MYTMKETCDQLNITYETLRFYCDSGLVPNVKRDRHNYRLFDQRDVDWLKSLSCLKRCGMSIKEMKQYMELCMQGVSSIDDRRKMLDTRRNILTEQIKELRASIDFIDKKNQYFADVLSGHLAYTSNLIPAGDSAE